MTPLPAEEALDLTRRQVPIKVDVRVATREYSLLKKMLTFSFLPDQVRQGFRLRTQ